MSKLKSPSMYDRKWGGLHNTKRENKGGSKLTDNFYPVMTNSRGASKRIWIPSRQEMVRMSMPLPGAIQIAVKRDRKQSPAPKNQEKVAPSQPIEDQKPTTKEEPNSPELTCYFCNTNCKNRQALRRHLYICPKRIEEIGFTVGEKTYTVTLNPNPSAIKVLVDKIERLKSSITDQNSRHFCVMECLELLQMMKKIKGYCITEK